VSTEPSTGTASTNGAATAVGGAGTIGGAGTRRTAGVVVASTRAAAGTYEDRSGPIIAEWLTAEGFEPLPVRVVPDGPEVNAALTDLLAEGVRIIITSGGTGLTRDDRTPEITAALLDKEVPGIMEAIRAAGRPHTPLSALSGGVAGVAGGTFVINLPGSPGGVRDGLAVLQPLIEHICTQLEGRRDAGHEGAGHLAAAESSTHTTSHKTGGHHEH
jgi:molybdenum cofactor synthesis domain-containing protein